MEKQKLVSSKNLINLMYVPALCFFAVFIFYPFIQGVYISFTDWNGFSADKNFIGFDNYLKFWSDDNAKKVLVNTLIYGFASTFFQNVFGLMYALLVDLDFKGRGLVRTIIYLPVIIAPLIMGYIITYLFSYSGGALNEILSWFEMAPVNWLAERNRAVAIIVIVNTFQFVGPTMLIYLTGLQTISGDYKEAAKIDGANGFQMFKGITFPLLMSSVTINIVYNLIGGLKLFDIVMSLTNGGPGYDTASLSTFMNSLYFGRQDAGYATTVGNVMFIMIAFIGLTILRYLRSKEVHA